MKNLNAYQITWAILQPKKGIVTKKDTRLGFSKQDLFLIDHACSLEAAKEKVNNLAGKLSKEYDIFFITDKQFGMSCNGNFKEVATSKQLSETFQIK